MLVASVVCTPSAAEQSAPRKMKKFIASSFATDNGNTACFGGGAQWPSIEINDNEGGSGFWVDYNNGGTPDLFVRNGTQTYSRDLPTDN